MTAFAAPRVAMSSLKKFFVQYSHFLIGNALSLLLGLITFPIFTRILTREEYGIMGLVTTTMFLMVALAKAGLSDGIIRFYKEYSKTPEQLVIFSSTVAVRGIILATMAALLFAGLFPSASKMLYIDQRYLASFMIVSIYVWLSPLNGIVMNILRATGKSIYFNAINFLNRVLSIAVGMFLLVYVFKALYGYFIGLILSELITFFILFYWFISHYKVVLSKVSGTLSITLIKFGAPLLITELSYLLLSYADRYMMVAYKGADLLGLYSVGYNLASYISNMVMFSLSYSVIPIYVELYETDGRKKTEEFLRKCTHYVLMLAIPVIIGYTAVSEDLFVTFASEKYKEAATFSPMILAGLLLLGMNNVLNAGLYLHKKSKVILSIMLVAAAVNLAMNVLLIPRFGIMGAVTATLVACLAATAMTIIFSFKYISITVSAHNILYYALLSGIMYVAVNQIHLHRPWMDLIAKVVTGMFIVSLGIIVKEKDIAAKVKSSLFASKAY